MPDAASQPSTPLSTLPSSSPASPELHHALHQVFGFSEFRALQQEAVREACAGRDVLVVMPTGAGKSLCFQLPAAISLGVTVVVSPLVALMRDQVEALKTRTEFLRLGCAYINSLQAPDEQRHILEQLRAGHLRLVYIAPERFRSGAFLEALRSVPIARFVVDEAHCISEWGHDFRPDYLTLRAVVESLGSPPLMAVTATATLRVQQSIIENLGMREPAKFIGGFNRPNLHFAAHRCKSESERQEKLLRALPKLSAMGGSGLIYVSTRKQCEEVAALAGRALASVGKSAAPYHAGMEASTRNALQSRWLGGQTQVLVATNAFGMGIDKPDVRFVVHYGYPDSLESYYQEAGRAGRDGRKSRCVILHHFADRRTREWFIDNDAMTPDDVKSAHTQICARQGGSGSGGDNGDDPNGGSLARIPRSWWMQTLGWNEVKARLAMGEMERAGVLRRVGETGEETVLHITRRDFPPAALNRIRTDLDRQRDERYRRLDEMTAYCKTTLCRRRTTLAYFGDLERPQTGGFCCDNCDRPAPSAAEVAAQAASVPTSRRDRAPMPLRVDGADIHSLLQGLDALWPKVGKARLNKLLRGSGAKDVQRFKAENCPLFGALRSCSQTQVDDFLERLIELGLLHQADEDEYFVCTVTTAGREAWQTKAEVDVTAPSAPRRRDDVWNEDESDLFETLRAWRRKESSALNLPPYCVLGDRALLEIARQKPQSETALRAITGIGDAKIEKYGAAVLSITRGEAMSALDGASRANGASPVVGFASDGATSKKVSSGGAAPGEITSNGTASDSATAALSRAAADLPGTVVDTYVMLQEGLDVDEIAARRELQSATVWSHVEKLIAADFLDPHALDALLPPELRERIEAALSAVPQDAGLKPVWEKLGGETDYGPIRALAAWRASVAPSAAPSATRPTAIPEPASAISIAV